MLTNLTTSCIEYRGEDDPDVTPYRHERREDIIAVEHAEAGAHCKDLLMAVLRGVIGELVTRKVRHSREGGDGVRAHLRVVSAFAFDLQYLLLGDLGRCCAFFSKQSLHAVSQGCTLLQDMQHDTDSYISSSIAEPMRHFKCLNGI